MEQTTCKHTHFKRLLSLLLAAVMCLSVMPMLHLQIEANANSVIETIISNLRTKFPNGKYWNHYANQYHNNNGPFGTCTDSRCMNPDSYTGSPCTSHTSTVGKGGYDCNCFDGGIQCYGFANKVFYDIHGVYASATANRKDTANVAVGDWIRVNNDSHSAVVIARNGNTLTVVECNLDLSGSQYNCYIRWDHTYSVSSVTYFKHSDAVNSSNAWFDDGTRFYAYIVKKDSWMSLQNMNGNVQLRDKADSYDPRQIWLFNRQSDLSYEIVNMYDGTCLDAYCHGTDPGTNVGTYTKNDQPAQRWFLKLTSNDDVNIIPSYCNLALDVSGNENNPGTNVMLWNYNDGGAQRYSIYKLDWDGLTYSKPAKPDASTISVKTLGTSAAPTVLQWTVSPLKNSFDERHYDLRIYEGTTTTGSPIVIEYYLSGLEYSKSLSAGTYTADIVAVNTKYKDYYTWGNSVTFTVPCEHNWNNGTVTTDATYFTTGINTYTCTDCGETKTETIPPLDIPTSPALVQTITSNGHTYSLYAAKMTWDEAKAWCESNGGYLCTITSQEEQKNVSSLISSKVSAWLGAERGLDDQFRWITCEQWSYSNWSEGEPNGSGGIENCIHIKDNFEWNDYSKTNSSPNGFIMERGDTPTAIHTWDSGKVTKEATCAVPGNKTFICTVCGTSRTETIEKTSVHTWDDGYITKEPTCAAAGNKTFTCSVCGTTRTETIAKPTSHKWDSGKVTKAATEKTEGVKTYTCSVCGEQKTEPIPPVTPVDPTDKATVTVGSVTARAGEEVEVPISIANNPGINTFSFGVDYDKDRLQLKDVAIDPALGGQFAFKEKAVWLNAADTVYNGTVLTLTFTVVADAQEGDIPIAVTYQPGDIANLKEEDVAFQLVPGKISVHAYTPGDINGDNKVNNKDLTRLMKYLAGDAVTVSADALDVNGDGKVNNKDLTRLMKYLAGDNVSIY